MQMAILVARSNCAWWPFKIILLGSSCSPISSSTIHFPGWVFPSTLLWIATLGSSCYPISFRGHFFKMGFHDHPTPLIWMATLRPSCGPISFWGHTFQAATARRDQPTILILMATNSSIDWRIALQHLWPTLSSLSSRASLSWWFS